MIKKGFTILESTFSIMILSIVISFGIYLSSKSFDSFNRFNLMNLAYSQHENRLNLVLGLMETNKLKFPSHFQECKLSEISVESFDECQNLSNFQIYNDLRVRKLNANQNLSELTPLFCQDDNCSSYDFKETEFENFPIYTILSNDIDNDLLEIKTLYSFKNVDYTIETKIKI